MGRVTKSIQVWVVSACMVHICRDTGKGGCLESSKDDKSEVWRMLSSLGLGTFVLERELRRDSGSQNVLLYM